MNLQQLSWILRYTAHSAYHTVRDVPVRIAQWRRFWNSYHEYNRMVEPEKAAQIPNLYPCIADATAETEIEPIYFYQDTWAFEKIVQLRPPTHMDVASHHKFVALLSKVVPVTMVDIRPLSLPLNTLNFQTGSILALPYQDNELPSVSSLCVVEHIGLGRYGDQLDPLGTEKAIAELKRVIAPGGSLFVSLPLDDKNRIYFNAHRAFQEDYLLSLFAPFEVTEARYIYGNSFGDVRQKGFGVGCYALRKP